MKTVYTPDIICRIHVPGVHTGIVYLYAPMRPFSPSIIYLKADRGAVYIQFNIPIETGRLDPCSDRNLSSRNVHFFFFVSSKLFIAFCNGSGNRTGVECRLLDRWSLLWSVGKKRETNFRENKNAVVVSDGRSAFKGLCFRKPCLLLQGNRNGEISSINLVPYSQILSAYIVSGRIRSARCVSINIIDRRY